MPACVKAVAAEARCSEQAALGVHIQMPCFALARAPVSTRQASTVTVTSQNTQEQKRNERHLLTFYGAEVSTVAVVVASLMMR